MAVKEVTPQTEFNKGWIMDEKASGETLIVENKPKDVVPDPTPEPEPVVEQKEEGKTVGDKDKVAASEIKPSEPVTKEEKSPDIVNAEDGNSETYKQRWKSQQGIVKSEMTKRAEAEKRAAELEEKLKKIKVSDIPQPDKEKSLISEPDEVDTLEEKYMDAVLDEDKALAIKIRKQIDGIKFKQFSDSVSKATTDDIHTTIQRQTMEQKIQSFASEIFKKYPFLDHNNEETANPYAIRLVRATRDDYRSQGMDDIKALEAAVNEVAPIFSKKTSSPEMKESISDDSIKSTVVVKTKSNPVKTGGKIPGTGSFNDGWNLASAEK